MLMALKLSKFLCTEWLLRKLEGLTWTEMTAPQMRDAANSQIYDPTEAVHDGDAEDVDMHNVHITVESHKYMRLMSRFKPTQAVSGTELIINM